MAWASARCKSQAHRVVPRLVVPRLPARHRRSAPPTTEAPFGGPPTSQHAASGCLVGCAHQPRPAPHRNAAPRAAPHRHAPHTTGPGSGRGPTNPPSP